VHILRIQALIVFYTNPHLISSEAFLVKINYSLIFPQYSLSRKIIAEKEK